MTVEQLKFRLNKIASSQTHSECALLCRELLEAAVSYIFEKTESRKPKNASLLELIDHMVVTSYIDDVDTMNSLHYVRILGMNAKHGRKVRKNEAKLAQENVTYLIGLLAAKEAGTEYA